MPLTRIRSAGAWLPPYAAPPANGGTLRWSPPSVPTNNVYFVRNDRTIWRAWNGTRVTATSGFEAVIPRGSVSASEFTRWGFNLPNYTGSYAVVFPGGQYNGFVNDSADTYTQGGLEINRGLNVVVPPCTVEMEDYNQSNTFSDYGWAGRFLRFSDQAAGGKVWVTGIDARNCWEFINVSAAQNNSTGSVYIQNCAIDPVWAYLKSGGGHIGGDFVLQTWGSHRSKYGLSRIFVPNNTYQVILIQPQNNVTHHTDLIFEHIRINSFQSTTHLPAWARYPTAARQAWHANWGNGTNFFEAGSYPVVFSAGNPSYTAGGSPKGVGAGVNQFSATLTECWAYHHSRDIRDQVTYSWANNNTGGTENIGGTNYDYSDWVGGRWYEALARLTTPTVGAIGKGVNIQGNQWSFQEAA